TKADAKHRVDFGEGLDPTARAHVEALRGSMNELVGRAEVGQDVMALPEFMQLVRDIENSGSLALIAEAYRFVGERNLRASLPIEASRWMHAAYHAALRAGHSDVAVLSLAHLLRVHG